MKGEHTLQISVVSWFLIHRVYWPSWTWVNNLCVQLMLWLDVTSNVTGYMLVLIKGLLWGVGVRYLALLQSWILVHCLRGHASINYVMWNNFPNSPPPPQYYVCFMHRNLPAVYHFRCGVFEIAVNISNYVAWIDMVMSRVIYAGDVSD
jgi:hypothetical protein